MKHETPASASTQDTPQDEAYPVQREQDAYDRYLCQMSELTREADSEFGAFRKRMEQNPQLAILAFTNLEPHLENYRQHMQMLSSPGYETSMIPFNWNVGSSEHEIVGVTPRVMLRRAMYHITTALTTQAMSMGQGRAGESEKLRNLYMAMATARWADEVLNSKARRAGDKPGLGLPKPAGTRGGARPGAGRPRKHTSLRPITDLSQDKEEDEE